MQVAILAGGLGTRLSTLTRSIPKPMVAVHRHPFLAYQFAWLKKIGMRRLILLVGYLAEQIQDYFGDGHEWGLSILYSCEPSPMGTAGALKLAEPLLEDEFLLLNGDSFLPIDYHLLIQRFKEVEAEALVVAYDNRDKVAVNNLCLSQDEVWANRYHKTDSSAMTHLDGGVYLFRKRVLSRIPSQVPHSLENVLLPELARERVLAAYTTGVRCYDIGTPERLTIFERAVSSDLTLRKEINK